MEAFTASYLHRKYIWQGFYRLSFLIGRKQARMLISDILQIRLFSNESSTTLCYVPLCVSLSLRITGKDDDRGDDDEKTMLLTMIMMIMTKYNNNSNDRYLPILIQHAAMIARGRRQVSTKMPILYLEYMQYSISNVVQICQFYTQNPGNKHKILNIQYSMLHKDANIVPGIQAMFKIQC